MIKLTECFRKSEHHATKHLPSIARDNPFMRKIFRGFPQIV
jgi:hypothetical protein